MSRAAHSYFHRGGDIALLGSTIGEHFATICGAFPDREAVVSIPQQQRLDYSEPGRQVERLALALIAAGFECGDRIGIWSTNNIEWLLLQLATARIGIILVNINPAYRRRELAYALQKSQVQGLFTIPSFRGSDYTDMLLELMPELRRSGPRIESREFPNLARVFLFDPADAAVFGVDDERLGEQVAAWIQLREAGSVEAEEIRAFCHDKIAHYIRFVDKFPMTVTGKLQKFRMREIMQQSLKSGK